MGLGFRKLRGVIRGETIVIAVIWCLGFRITWGFKRDNDSYSPDRVLLLLSSSVLGLPCGILNMNHKKELLRSLWVESRVPPPVCRGSLSSCRQAAESAEQSLHLTFERVRSSSPKTER